MSGPYQSTLPLTVLAQGAGGKALFTASPADTPDPMVALMREVAEKMDHPVPHPVSSVLDGLTCVEGDARAVATFNEGVWVRVWLVVGSWSCGGGVLLSSREVPDSMGFFFSNRGQHPNYSLSVCLNVS